MRFLVLLLVAGCASGVRFAKDNQYFGLCSWCAELSCAGDKCGFPDECFEHCPRE